MVKLTRRAALETLGYGAAAGVGLGAGLLIDGSSAAVAKTTSGALTVTNATVSSWVKTRGSRYYIGHRGSGDVYPEHSLEGYRAAAAAGAQCLEVSVEMTSDGQLICMHDATYDRTTTAKGVAAGLPAAVLRGVRLSAPQLGPAWAVEPRPGVPFLSDVLDALGGKVVLCIEAKQDAAYPSMMAMIEARGLKASVVVKAFYSSGRIPQARASGYPVFAYFGAENDLSTARINTLASQLDPSNDYIILPNSGKNGYIDSGLVRDAVATGVPVWVYASHRRVDAQHFFALGCTGIVGSSYQYLATTAPVASTDAWSFGAISPGEMTRDPASVTYAPNWSNNEIHLGAQGPQHFLTLGQLGPLAKAGAAYTIKFEASWLALPSALTENMTLAFGHADDAYYQHRSGLGGGYHALLRADGRLELFRHDDGRTNGTSLAASLQSPAPTPGQWLKFQLEVTPTRITWSRTDVAGATVSATDHTYRGGYLHIGRSSTDGVLAFRSLSVN